MARYFWRNANNDQNGTTAANYDISDGGAAHTVPPGVNDTIEVDGNEDFTGLPTSMVAEVGTIVPSFAYAGLTDFTDFAVDAVWSFFTLQHVTLLMSGTPIILSGGRLGFINNTGADAILNAENPVLAAGDCTIGWGFAPFNNLIIMGGLNADGNTITHTGSNDKQLICDVTGILDLGATADTGVAIDIDAVAGTVTVAANPFSGDYTQTSGNVTATGFDWSMSGNALYVDAGTVTDLNLIMNGTDKTIDWDDLPDDLASLTVNGNTTLTGDVALRALHGSANLDLDGFQIKTPGLANNFWTYTGVMSGGGSVLLATSSSRSNAAPIDTGDADITFQSTDDTFTLSTLITTGDIKIQGSSGTAICMVGVATSTLGAIQLGHDTEDRSGVLNYLSGMHSASTLVGIAASAGNAVDFGGGSHVEFSGLADFDNIAVTASTDMPPEIKCPDGGSVANCTPDNPIALFGDGSVDGGGNNLNITEFINNMDHPGGLMMRGIGGGRLIQTINPLLAGSDNLVAGADRLVTIGAF